MQTNSDRHIDLQGTPNFRDIGGIVTRNGSRVRWGVIFRSGSLAALTVADLERMKALRIATVIDFRMPDEVQREPDRRPDTCKKYIHATIGNPADMREAMESIPPASVTVQQVDGLMMFAYANFINNLNHFQPLFDNMLNGGIDESLLFHCTAGKDRTGIATALVLMLLDVDRNTIMDDYLLSNTYIEPYYQDNLKKMGAYGFAPEVIKELSSVKREYLQTLFDAIDKQYATVDVLFESVFGITPEMRKNLIEKYTIS